MKSKQVVTHAHPYAVTYSRWFRDRNDNQDYEEEIEYFRTHEQAESFASRIQTRSIMKLSNVKVIELLRPMMIDEDEDY